jgi:hypothetical protein
VDNQSDVGMIHAKGGLYLVASAEMAEFGGKPTSRPPIWKR